MISKSDPNWRAIFEEEYASWTTKSYEDLRVALAGVISGEECCVHYDREGPGGTYQVEVQPVENQPDYLHVLVFVSEPSGWRSLSNSFIRHADGRLDA